MSRLYELALYHDIEYIFDCWWTEENTTEEQFAMISRENDLSMDEKYEKRLFDENEFRMLLLFVHYATE